MTTNKTLKKTICKGYKCNAEIIMYTSLTRLCIPCAIKVAKKKQIEKRKKDRAILKEKKNELKSVSELLNEAQVVFNKYIRFRDAKLPCISCLTEKTNIQYHAGHYIARGSSANLRFNEDNVWKQCATCNNIKSGNQAMFRIELIKRIGIDRVNYLESNYINVRRFTKEEALNIKQVYKNKLGS